MRPALSIRSLGPSTTMVSGATRRSVSGVAVVSEVLNAGDSQLLHSRAHHVTGPKLEQAGIGGGIPRQRGGGHREALAS